jgi:uncharacterized protein YacL
MLNLIRVLFLVLVSAVVLTYTLRTATDAVIGTTDPVPYYVMVGCAVAAFALFSFDVVLRKKNLRALSGMFFGLLVGVIVSLALGFLVDQVARVFLGDDGAAHYRSLIDGAKLLVGLMMTYITVSFILQTKDDFRFIIPYVEFSRATKGARPLIVDTSIIIDGRIADLASTGMFESRMLVPRFVLNELQQIADSGDRLKRSRGRRGLDILQRLQANPKLELHIWDGTLTAHAEGTLEGVDQKLVALALQEGGRIVTNDFNLLKVAQLRGVDVINLNAIADALKPVVLPGEPMRVRVVKPGEGPSQGVGYLEDGTMVVVEGARDKIGQEVEMVVTNALQTAAGKMIFGRVEGSAAPAAKAKTT